MISSIEAWEFDRSVRIEFDGGDTDMKPYIKKFTVTDRLGEYGRQPSATGVMEVGFQTPPATADPPVLTRRRVIRVNYESGSVEEFRIVKFGRTVSGGKDPALSLEPLWLDLQGRVSREIIASNPPRTVVRWYAVNRTPEEALSDIMSRNAPSGFVAGNVAATLAVARVTIDALALSPLQLIEQLCKAVSEDTGLPCEWDVVRDGQNYRIDLVEQIGGVINHPVDGYGATHWNRREATQYHDATRLFTRVVPLGGPDEEAFTIAGASWTVLAVAGGRVSLEGNPIHVNNAPSAPGLALVDVESGTSYAVVGTEAPNVVVVSSSTPSIGDRVRFMSGVNELVYIADGDAEDDVGVRERPVRRSDIAPYANVLEEANVSPDLSDWSAGLPVGVSRSPDMLFGDAVSAVVVTQVSDREYVSAGTSAMKVETGEGQYVETLDIDLSGDGYVSLWVNLRVLTGSVRLSLVNATTGVHYPRDEEAIGHAALELEGLTLGGLSPPTTDTDMDYRIRLTALEDGTEFVVDSWTLTRSSGPYDYAPNMGPNELWKAGFEVLRRDGGAPPARIEATWFDLTKTDIGGFDNPVIGATVHAQDAGIDEMVRMVEVSRTLAGQTEIVRGKLGARPSDFMDYMVRTGRKPQASRIGPGGALRPRVEVAVEDGRANPIVRIVYPRGIRQIRLEVPARPAALADGAPFMDPAAGPAGTAPDAVEAATVTINILIFDNLAEEGGELSYIVGTDQVASSGGGHVLEDDFLPGTERGQYRVFAVLTKRDVSTAYIVWAGVLRGPPQAAPAVEHDPPIATTLAIPLLGDVDIIRVSGVHATGAGDDLALVWQYDGGDWSVVAEMDGSFLPANVAPAITQAADDSWTISVLTASGAVRYLTVAARTGAGTADDPYLYHDVTDFTVMRETLPSDINRLVDAVPMAEDTADLPDGTMLWTRVP